MRNLPNMDKFIVKKELDRIKSYNNSLLAKGNWNKLLCGLNNKNLIMWKFSPRTEY